MDQIIMLFGASASEGTQPGPGSGRSGEGEAGAFGAMLGGLVALSSSQPAALAPAGGKPTPSASKENLALDKAVEPQDLAGVGLVPVNLWITRDMTPEGSADAVTAASGGAASPAGAWQGSLQDFAAANASAVIDGAAAAVDAPTSAMPGAPAPATGPGLSGLEPVMVSDAPTPRPGNAPFDTIGLAQPAGEGDAALTTAVGKTPDPETMRTSSAPALVATGAATVQPETGEPAGTAPAMIDEPVARPEGPVSDNLLPAQPEPAHPPASPAMTAQTGADPAAGAETVSRSAPATVSPGAGDDWQSAESAASADEMTGRASGTHPGTGEDKGAFAGSSENAGSSAGNDTEGQNSGTDPEKFAMAATRIAGDDPASVAGEFAAGLEGELRLTGSSAEPGALIGAAARVPQQIAERVEKAFRTGDDRLVVELHPAELGGVEIRLRTGADGALVAELIVERPETLADLQRDLHDLAQRLEDAGITLDEDGLQLSLRGESGTGQGFADDRRHEPQAGRGAMGGEPVPEATTETSLLQPGAGGGDRLLDLIL